MKVLIVEDDLNKSRQLCEATRAALPEATIQERRSYRSGLAAVIDGVPDVVLLDMTLPTYDIVDSEAGGRTRPFGGRDVLYEMARRELHARVIVVTQFESFGEGAKRITLKELTLELEREFSDFFCGTVYYHPARADWRSEIQKMLERIVSDAQC